MIKERVLTLALQQLKQEINSYSKTDEFEAYWLQYFTEQMHNVHKCMYDCLQKLRDQPESETGKGLKT